MRLIVQIPAYNEESSIVDVIKSIPKKVRGIKKVEILVIDDGSRDNTAQAAKKAGADYVFKNKRNRGLGYTFRTAIKMSLQKGADIIVNIDADGQFDPADIPKLIEPILSEEADMVTCTRFKEIKPSNMPLAKKIGNYWFTRLVSKITKQDFTDTQCGFRAYSKEAALRLHLVGRFTYTQEAFIDLVDKGMVIKEIPLKVIYKDNRVSVISGKLSRYGVKSLATIARATRDTQPLTFFGVPGTTSFIIGFVGGLISFVYWLLQHVTTPVRMLFSASVFLMIFGLSLIILALIADMLKRINRTQEEVLYMLKSKDYSR